MFNPSTDSTTLHVDNLMVTSFQYRWFLDGMDLSQTGSSLPLRAIILPHGNHQIRLVMTDATSWVRNDPTHALVEEHTWQLSVGVCAPGTTCNDPCVGVGNTCAACNAADGCGFCGTECWSDSRRPMCTAQWRDSLAECADCAYDTCTECAGDFYCGWC